MSRTYKDSYHLHGGKNRRLMHNIQSVCKHHLAGTSGVRRVNPLGGWRDEGKYVREVVEKEYYVPVFAKEITEDMELVPVMHDCGEITQYAKRVREVTTRRWVAAPLSEPQFVTWKYADHCTLNEYPLNRLASWVWHRSATNENGERYTCYKTIGWGYWYTNRPRKEERNMYHREHRNKARIQDRNLARLYNSGEDLEEYDWEDPNYPQHHGWWD